MIGLILCHKWWNNYPIERGARQGDLISGIPFHTDVKVLFFFILKNPEIRGIEIFKHFILYTAYADDTTLFLN